MANRYFSNLSRYVAFPRRVSPQFRIATLFHVTSLVAGAAALFRAVGIEGILFHFCLALIPVLLVVLAWAYIRVMSWLFDVVVGPFFLR